jgi:hypothetical protein
LLHQAREIGFHAIVQVLSWQEIEPIRGQWYWEYSDWLGRAAEFYSLELIVRLDQPPKWALRDSDGIPFDAEAYVNFVEHVARRYRGRVRAYIIWNEPNLAAEWGAPPDPAAYTRLLQQAYTAIKRADSGALVASAGLAPTNEQTDRAMDDRVFLTKMYESGARPFFDVLAVHPYGFAYSPDDPYGEHQGLNYNRILDLRAIMQAFQDDAKPIWATEIGWTTEEIGDHAWMAVTPSQQADYLVRALHKARNEMPWMHLFTVWNLSCNWASGDEKAGYSLLREDGTYKPAGKALQNAFGFSPDFWDALVGVLPDPSPIHILARDTEIHLGDDE